MPITRKQQILVKLETSEGTNANPGASDAVLVYEPTIQDSVETNERVPAGSTLSREVVPVGRKTRQITFTSDFRGSGDTTAPVTEPEWGTLAKMSAFQLVQPVKIPITAPSGPGYQVGEIVRKSSTIRGVVLGAFVGGALTHRLTAAGDLVVAPLEGVFTSTGTLTGESSGNTGTIGTVADYDGLCYKPDSEKRINVTTGAWAPGNPAVGDVLIVKNGTAVTGHAQLIANNGGFTDLDLTMLWGDIDNGYTLTKGANSATINAAPTATRTPSGTIRHNLDGRRRDLVGARGDFQMQGDSGGPIVFNWTFSGDPDPSTDALPVATSGLSSIRAPRLFGAICAYGLKVSVPDGDTAEDFYRLPTKSVGFQAGNAIEPNLDANQPGGSTGANVTDRDPQLLATIDQVHSGFDVESYRDNAQTIHVAIIAGTTPGNIVGIVAPNCQVYEANGADASGVATFELNLRPRRVLEGGDDEIYLFQL